MFQSSNRVSSSPLGLRRWPLAALAVGALALAAPPAFSATTAVTVVGTINNSLTGQRIVGATVTFEALNRTFSAVTDETGVYRVRVVANASYLITFSATNFETETLTGSIIKRKRQNRVRLIEDLVPVANVVVEASATGSAEPGATLDLSGTCTPLDGSTVLSTDWVQSGGTMADIADFMSADTTVMLAPLGAYKDELIHLLKEPPITNEELPPNVPLPEGEFVGGLQERTQVVAVVPYTLEKAAHVGLDFECETTSGIYSAAVELQTALPWPVTTGLRTVPNGVPVLLYTPEDASYNWTMMFQPLGSTAMLADSDSQTPWFTPDKSGVYEIMESVSGKTLTVHSGLWHGAIDPVLTEISVQFGDGLPEGDENCTGCHDGGAAPDAFTPWRETGHAHAFSDGLNTNSHFSGSCFGCHAVGVNPDANNAGFDDVPNYDAFLNSGLLNNPNPNNWLDMLIMYPDVARLANIQCESCHGPQSYTEAHGGVEGAPRVSVASEVCASCHGEPARHGRYQQWQLSRHSNYELAVDEGDSGNCSRCHTGNGFVAWSKLGFDKDTDVNVTWDADSVHPQTCAACHGPHETGTVSGSDPVAGVRIDGDSPELISGYTAIGIGKGALCITCHNTRRGARNDDVFDSLSSSDKTRGPHGPTQGDLMMGQNAYFVEVGNRGRHSLIEDTCVTCHMEETPPPALLSYNESGTNHTFFADKTTLCSNCHGNLNADGVQGTVNSLMSNLVAEQGEAYMRLMVGALPLTLPADNTSSSNQANWVTGCGSNVINAADEIQDVVWTSSTRITITYSGGTCTNANPANILTSGVAANLFELSLLPEGGDGALVKAAWNYSMSNNDGSRGLHNPDFTTRMLQNALNAVSAIQ